MLKLTIAIAAAIIAYTAYVYIGRLCIPMIKRESSSLGSRTMGSEYPQSNFRPPHTHIYMFLPDDSRVRGRVRRVGIDDDLGIHKGALRRIFSCSYSQLTVRPSN